MKGYLIIGVKKHGLPPEIILYGSYAKEGKRTAKCETRRLNNQLQGYFRYFLKKIVR